jgi:ubiquinone/menaquinone biosynthesis C-methylase UbiE
MSVADHYDGIYGRLAASPLYRDILASVSGLPAWVAPFSPIDRALLMEIADDLAMPAGGRIADIACGMGGPGLWIAERLGARIAGVDVSRAAIACAERTATALGWDDRAAFTVADASATGLDDASVDGVMSIYALMFVDAPDAIAEMARVLRPGGRAVVLAGECIDEVVLSTMVRDYAPVFAAAGFTGVRKRERPAAREQSLRMFRALLERAGDLTAELGAAAAPILDEARETLARAARPPRVRDVTLVAQKP